MHRFGEAADLVCIDLLLRGGWNREKAGMETLTLGLGYEGSTGWVSQEREHMVDMT